MNAQKLILKAAIAAGGTNKAAAENADKAAAKAVVAERLKRR